MRDWLLKGCIGLLVASLGVLILAVRAQEEEPPSWLIRKPPAESVIHIGVWTGEGWYPINQPVEGLAHFRLDRPAYVYLLNISPGGRVHLLLPNRSSPDNFFKPGSYQLQEAFRVEGPDGTAYIQAIATPTPLDLTPSPIEEFLFLGDDPKLVLGGIQLMIQEKGLAAGDWAADWTSYAALSVLPFTGARCGELIIEVKDAETEEPIDRQVQAHIDKSCLPDGRPIQVTFMGPRSDPIPNVREGPRTVTVTVEGYQTLSQSVYVPHDQPKTETFSLQLKRSEQGVIQDFHCEVTPLNPLFGQKVTFDCSGSKAPIVSIDWDFGDGSRATTGLIAEHIYHPQQGAGPWEFVVRAVATLRDSSNSSWSTILEIHNPNGCPDNTLNVELLPDGVRISGGVSEEDEEEKCAKVVILEEPVDIQTKNDYVHLSFRSLFETYSEGLQALVLGFVEFLDANDKALQWERIRLATPAYRPEWGFQDHTFTWTDFSPEVIEKADKIRVTIKAYISPKQNGELAFQLWDFELQVDSPPCTPQQARLETARRYYYVGEEVQIIFTNISCPAIELPNTTPWVILSQATGLEVYHPDAEPTPVEVEAGQEKSWTWNQQDGEGNQVPPGSYSVILQTSAGTYYLATFTIMKRF